MTRITAPSDPAFTVCTLVTRWNEYEVMRATFVAHGFDETSTEYLAIDNSAGNTADAYQAINLFLRAATAPYVLLCHQDVELVDDGVAELDREIRRIGQLDPNWAVLGNAGSSLDGRRVMRISDPRAANQQPAGLPVRVTALDENFLLVRAEANLAVSRDLGGFHHYGHDLCIIADVLGWSSHVIDFHLLHKSGGSLNVAFDASRRAIRAKYARAFRGRAVAGTTQRPYMIGGSATQRLTGTLLLQGRRLYRRLARRLGLPGADRDAWG